MYDSLSTLYRCMVPSQAEVAAQLDCYEEAQTIWASALAQGDTLDLEDAANLREYGWGLYSFAAGVRLGLTLSAELNTLTPRGF